jgi:ribosome maturation factor RimP
MEKEDFIRLLEPAINAMGYELVDLDLRQGRGGLLRLFIDRPPTVTLADCEFVSEQIGDLLDVEDPMVGNYRLEVSSPGSDRRLRTPAHFVAAVGSDINVELKRAVEGRKRFRGRLTGADNEAVDVQVDGRNWHLPLADMRIARLVPAD